jgi:hypothetical protein
MFTICTAFVAEGKLDETLEELASSEKNFTREIGVLFPQIFSMYYTTPYYLVYYRVRVGKTSQRRSTILDEKTPG